jgi:exosortase A-associated hydrolase 2
MPRVRPPEPVFIDGSSGRLFAVLYGPADGRDGVPCFLYLPPYGEEMNRSRRTSSILGQALARQDIALLTLDPSGTGDSQGESEACSWSEWLEDAAAALAFLEGRRYSVAGTIGLRLGGLLALAVAERHTLARSILWQPVIDGRAYVTSVLQSRLLRGLTKKNGAETSEELRGRLAAGEPLDILGYPLSTRLASELEALRIADICTGFHGRVDWVHIAASPIPEVKENGGHERRLEKFRTGTGAPVHGCRVQEPPFWLLEEAPLPQTLIELTIALCGEEAKACPEQA